MAESIPVTDYKDLRRLYTGRKQVCRNAMSDNRTIHALDTETYKGNIFLIADSDGRYLDNNISAIEIIQFLFHKKYQDSWNFFYNIGYDAEVILKLLHERLFSYNHNQKLSFKVGDYHLKYIPNKCLRIMKGRHSVTFYDIAQFFGGSSLTKAYQDNIADLPGDYLELKGKRDQFSNRFYGRNKTKVRTYCIQDCKLTKALAEKWIDLFHNAFGFYPQRWISSGYLAEKVLVNSGIQFPKFDSMPYEVQEIAFRSYFGGRFEILKRGFIGEAYLYDINSAYPFAITELPDLNNGEWIKGTKSIHPKAKLGFFLIDVDIPDCKRVPPFPFRKNGNLLFPSGKFKTYATLDELRACESMDFYKILESWQFIPFSDKKPYKGFIEGLYKKRLELKKKNDPLQLPIKIILNSIYGKTGQKINNVIGNLFNPVLFAFITGQTRARLYRFVIDNKLEPNVIAFATDSICTTKRLEINSERLGEFSLSNSGKDVYYLQNGIYRFSEKWKQRGFGRLEGKEIEHLETVERQGHLFYRLNLMRNSRLRASIRQNRLSEIGKIRPVIREINLNADSKRFWLGKLVSIDSQVCNESVPVSLSYFSYAQG